MAKAKKEDINNSIISNYDSTVVKTLNACIEQSSPALLVGQTGLGKTTLISELAKQANKNLIRLSVHSGVTADEILGKWLAKNGSTVWQDGLLVQAMKNGDWIVFDEINACPADVLFALHSLLDDDRKVTLIEKDGEEIKPQKDFRFFATMNPIEDYAGTKELNMAFFSRFGAVLEIKAFPHSVEVEILKRKGIKEDTAKFLVNIASNLRIYKNNEDIVYFCGTRDLIHAGNLIEKGLSDVDAVAVAILNKASKDDIDFIRSKDLSLKIKTKEEKEIERLNQEIIYHKNGLDKLNILIADKDLEILKLNKIQNNNNYNLNDDTKKALKKLGILTEF